LNNFGDAETKDAAMDCMVGAMDTLEERMPEISLGVDGKVYAPF